MTGAIQLFFLSLTMSAGTTAGQQDLSCTTFTRSTVAAEADIESVCQFNSCLWLEALEQNGTETGRCYQCSQQSTRQGCQATGICFWTEGRDELGGSDCTLCAGRTEQDCLSVGYCFWDVEGFENLCSKCPGYMDRESCSAGGEYCTEEPNTEKNGHDQTTDKVFLTLAVLDE